MNGKDIIRKVMVNACYYIFDTFAMIFKVWKRPNCMLSDANINALCMQFCEVFVLWDGAFLLARTINPIEIDCSTYRMYVRAAVNGAVKTCDAPSHPKSILCWSTLSGR